jgi:replication factor C subunit 1
MKTKRRMVLEDDDDDGKDDNDRDNDNRDEDFVDTAVGSDEDTDEDFSPAPQPSRSKPPSKPKAKAKPKPSPRTPPPSTTKRATRNSPPSTATSSSKKRKAPSSSTKKKATPEKLIKSAVHLVEPGPELEQDGFDEDAIQVAECMAGLTFVFTGNMANLQREDALEMVKTLGGRVTTAVSGKTNYLVVGPVLEDGRDYKEGSKYKKAQSYDGKVKLVMGENQLYGLCHYYHDRAMKEKGIDPAAAAATTTTTTTSGKTESSTTSSAAVVAAAAVSNPYGNKNKGGPPPPSNPYAKKLAVAPVSNPYAKKGPVSNPYAKKAPSNPYAKKGPSNPYAKSAAPSSGATGTTDNNSSSNSNINSGCSSLWVDRHKPVHTREILGNKTNVKKLQDWLRTWEKTFNNAKASGKTFSNPRGGPWKAALLSGPPGIGSTCCYCLFPCLIICFMCFGYQRIVTRSCVVGCAI